MPSVHHPNAAPPLRKWKPLSAALAYTATHDQNFAHEVELDRGLRDRLPPTSRYVGLPATPRFCPV